MGAKKLPGALLLGIFVLSAIPLVLASTTCETTDCEVTITLNIAFSGADDAYIKRMKNEIEDVWQKLQKVIAASKGAGS
ncbi:MAG: hypothetical protein GXO65_06945 [Euryarchaeota archaeon]|nr:hypothetical protein [Euryarchaeota archaeon]